MITHPNETRWSVYDLADGSGHIQALSCPLLSLAGDCVLGEDDKVLDH